MFFHRELNHALIFKDYFFKRLKFGPIKFSRQFQMRKKLFLYIVDSISFYNPWFVQKKDALERLGLSAL